MEKHIIIGIDPDTNESGVAVIRGGAIAHITTMNLFTLFEYIRGLQPNNVCISAGWLNKVTNFQNREVEVRVRERISERIGANHEIGKQIALYCHEHGISYTLVRPIGKKVNSRQFGALTGYVGRTNQEERDAAMAALFYVDKRG